MPNIIQRLFPRTENSETFLFPIFPKYITKTGARKLREYNYRGNDMSISYRFILSPFADFILNHFVPLGIHPNVITLLSLFTNISLHLIILVNSYYDLILPRWVLFLGGILTLVYQTLDNLDGKQARRIGASSPLGLVLDHGVDALTVTLSSINMMVVFQYGPSLSSFLIWVIPATVFFLTTWEEFYSGVLSQPLLNGPNEGLLMVASLYFITGYFGQEFWHTRIDLLDGYLQDIQLRDIILSFNLIWASIALLINLINVTVSETEKKTIYRNHFTKIKENKVSIYKSEISDITYDSDMYLSKPPRFRDAISSTFPFGIGVVLSALWIMKSESNIFLHHSRLCLFLIGLLFSKLVTHLQLSHVCGVKYYPWRKTVYIPLFILLFYNLLSSYVSKDILVSYIQRKFVFPVSEYEVLVLCVVLSGISWIHMVVSIVWEMSIALNISIFRVSHDRKKV